MSTRPIPTPFDAPLPGEPGAQPVQPQKQVATPFDAPLPGESGGPDDAPVQKPKSYLAYALGIDPTSPQTPANPQQPGEQFALQYPAEQGKLATAAGIGAGGAGLVEAGPALAAAGAKALTPAVIALGNLAEAHPILRNILTKVIQGAAQGTAAAAGYKTFKKFLESH